MSDLLIEKALIEKTGEAQVRRGRQTRRTQSKEIALASQQQHR